MLDQILNYKLNKKGFTLAEILVTLTIIGVIAALTVPALILNIQDDMNRNAWKKIYSEIQNAYYLVNYDNAGTLKDAFTNSDELRDTIMQYMIKAAKQDDIEVEGEGHLWHADGEFYRYEGTPWDWSFVNNHSNALLPNGMLVSFYLRSSSCEYAGLACNNQVTKYFKRTCGDMFIDVNGRRGPNTVGKDIFFIAILDTEILPGGHHWDYSPAYTTCLETNKDTRGEAWSALKLYE